MSDGITDAKRECKPIRYTSSHINPAPIRCKGCVFITCSPPDAQWECTNPLQHGEYDEPNNCAFHITLEELAIYTRERLKDKLIKEPIMLDKTLRCKHVLDDGRCSKLDNFQCPFVVIWDIAKTMCKGYDANVRYEVHVLGKSTSIIGVFKTREQAEQFIKDNIKIVEVIP